MKPQGHHITKVSDKDTTGASVSVNGLVPPEESTTAPWIDPVQAFFEGFSDFVYDHKETPARQFNRLSREKGWSHKSLAHQKALRSLNTALMRRFDPSYEDHTLTEVSNTEKCAISDGLSPERQIDVEAGRPFELPVAARAIRTLAFGIAFSYLFFVGYIVMCDYYGVQWINPMYKPHAPPRL
ncbi:hypothetical protein P691DRAFT_807871 [Macrolepiota fuliginosa MF-IS2]|uniref:Uncharacterized protein n=1 Tax=Macrolepiota fuliginosa MF-IS2 TaxID=1400762 RepID=A0A9P6C012_9AGAR|nr:hypothetical protein P691DRAFT_807871 [Macrolepiota fuliginosa MF-IS2]